jgi:ATP synthase protein I
VTKIPNKKTPKGTFAKALSIFSTMALLIAACMFIGVFVGNLLDKWLGTAPWLLLLFSLLGMAAAFKSLYDYIKRI